MRPRSHSIRFTWILWKIEIATHAFFGSVLLEVFHFDFIYSMCTPALFIVPIFTFEQRAMWRWYVVDVEYYDCDCVKVNVGACCAWELCSSLSLLTDFRWITCVYAAIYLYKRERRYRRLFRYAMRVPHSLSNDWTIEMGTKSINCSQLKLRIQLKWQLSARHHKTIHSYMDLYWFRCNWSESKAVLSPASWRKNMRWQTERYQLTVFSSKNFVPTQSAHNARPIALWQ